MKVEVRRFSDLLTDIVDNRGRTCPTSESGTPLIATNCIRNERLYPSYDKIRYVSADTYHSWFRGHPKPGDLIFVTKGSPGRVCLAPDPVGFCIAQDMVAIRPDPCAVYPRYLLALLRSRIVQTSIEQLHVGTLIPHFKKGDFDKLLLPIPAQRSDQVFIGDLFFQFSRKIELNRQMNETLEAMARAIFKSWFVDFEPVRAKAEGRDPGLPNEIASLFPDRFEESTEIPAGWAVGSLAEYADLNPESWSKKEHPEEIEYVDLSNTKWGRIEGSQAFAWSDAPSRARRRLRVGDTIVGTVRPGNGSFSLVGDEGLTGSTGFAVLRPKKAASVEFVYLAASSPNNIGRLSHLAHGAAYPAVRPNIVLETEVVSPNSSLIERFSELVQAPMSRIAANERESRTLVNLRDTLLPKLLSGELSVSDL